MKTIFTPFVIVGCLLACGSNSSGNSGKVTEIFPDVRISKTDTVVDFENGEVGKMAAGFKAACTGEQQNLDWKIVNDNGKKVIAQLASNDGDYYNLLVLENPGFDNFKMTAKIKAVSGNEDQGGGLMWRYIDNNNYYLARYNPLENNFRLYRVVKGNRKQLKSESADLGSGTWFTITVEMTGNKISCALNGNKMIETTDDTFSKPGRIGFWTKADAVTYFDDLVISPWK
jgi:3',5'-cyclic AMP phosphodiesterase CpdA